jgi:hypothetical protein
MIKNIFKITYLIFIKIIISPNFIFNYYKISKKKNLDFRNKGYFFLKSNLIDIMYNKINHEINFINITKLINDNLSSCNNDSNLINSGDKTKLYRFSIKKYLRPEFINEISLFFKSDVLLKEMSSRLGFKFSLTDFEIFLNHHNSNTGEEGSKLWHRDDDSIAGQLKVFFILNDLNEKSGGFFYFLPRNIIKNYNKLDISIERRRLKSTWNKYRVTDEEIKKKINLENVKIIYGKRNPELLIIDTNDLYHKGGYIKQRNSYRVMIEAIYSPYFNLSLLNDLYKKSFLYCKIFHILRGIKNRLRTII